MKVRNIWNLSSKLTNLLLDYSRDSQTQVLDLSMGMFHFVRSCIHTLKQIILAASTSSSAQPTLSQSVDSDAGAAHGVENGPSRSKAETTTNTTMAVLDSVGLGQVRPNESTSWWNYVGWTSASTSNGTTVSTLTRPVNNVAVASIQVSVANGSQELKPTTPSAAIGNANAESATIIGLGSAGSGLVNEAEDGKSAEPTEKAEEEVQGSDRPVPISSWYSPWGWYSSTNASGHVQLESESLEVKPVSENPQIDVPLPVSRSEPISAALSEFHEGGYTPSVPAHPLPINPISTSMEANWGGWASFFSSRALMVKTLGYGGGGRVQDVKRDEDGMEVMDLDDEDEGRDVGEDALLKDSGCEIGVRGNPMSSSPIVIAKTRPIILKSSDSQDGQTSPELMAGQSQLTQEIDVWAFSITCVEILTMGRIPWGPLQSDESVRHFVLQDILRACWSTKPTQRPAFSKVVKDFKQLRNNSGQEVVESPRIPVIEEESETTSYPSPDMRPTSFPEHLQAADNDLCELFSSPIFFLSLLTCEKADDILPHLGNIFQDPQQISGSSDVPHSESTVSTEDMKKPELVMYTPAHSSRSSSIITPPSSSSSEEHPNVIDYDSCDSPPPIDEKIANIWNERRYRLLLTHDYHPSRRSI